MKLIAVSIFAIAILASTATGLALLLSMHAQRAEAGEPCVGMECWPASWPVKHRPAYRPTLPPVW
jgi:hypothetical protein